ncbi:MULTISPECIES: trehalose-phosphatase [unclassified Sphingomonas]|uniref:trehalose-phosphatase n=1 Tax=unclassified Sphingomonas TaxID=196159 RepID=UPI0021514FC6|nr:MULTISPECIES: trehalose-phosphatase [unclassified Sphingomonas]MCR5871066.1 trehalose-phosphatase [Sphingomonas sp. J344]UUY00616.1 trehalose-phosphatase [Sphingomonas sp. J315]
MPKLAEMDTAALLAPPPMDLANNASLFLDFDGTLVEIAQRPDAIEVDARLRGLISALGARFDRRVAIVSGRGAEEIDLLFGGAGCPIVGSHGAELRGVEAAVTPERPAALDAVAERFRSLADAISGVLVEVKPLGIGLHYRGAPDAETACRALAEELAGSTGLTLQRGKMVFELRAPGDKGRAIAALMASPPFAGSRPIFLGDDLTDEPGFATAARLGGAGVLVGPVRQTEAVYRLPDVAAALRWLEMIVKDAA